MSRFPQPPGAKGSLKHIQRAVNARRAVIDPLILAQLPGAGRIEWLSPLAEDDHAEYRDAAFLERLGVGHLKTALAEFWPAHGPQWDALGRTDRGDLLLVEAKAHVPEMRSSCGAGEGSRARIAAALGRVAEALGAACPAPWTELFYQLANRIAHLHFLRENGEQAYLVLVGFVGDSEMAGPSAPAEWEAAYAAAWRAMDLPAQHPLARRIIHVHPDVGALA